MYVIKRMEPTADGNPLDELLQILLAEQCSLLYSYSQTDFCTCCLQLVDNTLMGCLAVGLLKFQNLGRQQHSGHDYPNFSVYSAGKKITKMVKLDSFFPKSCSVDDDNVILQKLGKFVSNNHLENLTSHCRQAFIYVCSLKPRCYLLFERLCYVRRLPVSGILTLVRFD